MTLKTLSVKFCSKKYDNGSENDEDIERIHGYAHKSHRATSSTI